MVSGIKKHFAGPQYSSLLSGNNPHKGGQGCSSKGERGGQDHRPCSPVQPKSLLGGMPSCQDSASSALSVSSDQEKAASDLGAKPVSWGSEQLVRAG